MQCDAIVENENVDPDHDTLRAVKRELDAGQRGTNAVIDVLGPAEWVLEAVQRNVAAGAPDADAVCCLLSAVRNHLGSERRDLAAVRRSRRITQGEADAEHDDVNSGTSELDVVECVVSTGTHVVRSGEHAVDTMQCHVSMEKHYVT